MICWKYAFDLKMDNKAVKLIMRWLDDRYLDLGVGIAKQIFKYLDKHYEHKNTSSQMYIGKKLLNLKYNPEESLNKFLVTFDNLINEYRAAGGTLTESLIIQYLFKKIANF